LRREREKDRRERNQWLFRDNSEYFRQQNVSQVSKQTGMLGGKKKKKLSF
jgi:hypothetical protein